MFFSSAKGRDYRWADKYLNRFLRNSAMMLRVGCCFWLRKGKSYQLWLRICSTAILRWEWVSTFSTTRGFWRWLICRISLLFLMTPCSMSSALMAIKTPTNTTISILLKMPLTSFSRKYRVSPSIYSSYRMLNMTLSISAAPSGRHFCIYPLPPSSRNWL